MYSKLPYIHPTPFYTKELGKCTILCLKAFRKDKNNYRAVYGYFTIHNYITETLHSHARKFA